ncbi:hypothetical protein Tco_0744913, partial [Tanacetum coccineum]
LLYNSVEKFLGTVRFGNGLQCSKDAPFLNVQMTFEHGSSSLGHQCLMMFEQSSSSLGRQRLMASAENNTSGPVPQCSNDVLDRSNKQIKPRSHRNDVCFTSEQRPRSSWQ